MQRIDHRFPVADGVIRYALAFMLLLPNLALVIERTRFGRPLSNPSEKIRERSFLGAISVHHWNAYVAEQSLPAF
jgi:hypothetical protein